VAGSCEHGNEPSDCILSKTLLNVVSYCLDKEVWCSECWFSLRRHEVIRTSFIQQVLLGRWSELVLLLPEKMPP